MNSQRGREELQVWSEVICKFNNLPLFASLGQWFDTWSNESLLSRHSVRAEGLGGERGGKEKWKKKKGVRNEERRRGEISRGETTVTPCKIHVKSASRCFTVYYIICLHVHMDGVPLSWSVWPCLHTWVCCMCPHSSGQRDWVCVCKRVRCVHMG